MKFLVTIFLLFFSFNSFAEESKNTDTTLSLEEYLAQVKNQNLNYDAAEKNAEAFELLKKKAKLVTAITVFGNSQTGFVEQNQALQIVRYTESYAQSSQVGLSQVSSLGINTRLTYTLNHITYKGLNTANFPNPALASSNYQVIPAITVSLPLWQNRLGAATKAAQDSTYFANENQKLLAKSVSIQSLVEAEKAYWALVYAKKSVEIQRNAVVSAKKILDYVQKRQRMNLGDKADVLQARALYETKKLNLQQAENDLMIAARSFNKYRYIDSAEVAEELADIDYLALQNFAIPKVKVSDRYDVKAQEASMKAAVANAKIDEESGKPALNLYGSYSTNQIAGASSQAMQNTFVQVGRVATVGVNFSAPINFFTTADIRYGARQSAAVAKTIYRQKLFEQENDWQNLVQNLTVYQENVRLSLKIEEVQKQKLENERFRLRQGRTSTYQVLLFEQDYSNSQLATIQTATVLLNLIADQKLYGN